jgi:hypothetical protein
MPDVAIPDFLDYFDAVRQSTLAVAVQTEYQRPEVLVLQDPHQMLNTVSEKAVWVALPVTLWQVCRRAGDD